MIASKDGFYTPEVGRWSETKYDLIFNYTSLFSTGMKKIWERRVYIDLYSGSGKAQIRNTDKVVYTSPLLAIKVNDPFDKYIFCDIDEKNVTSLQERINIEDKKLDCTLISGDCNDRIEEIISKIPQYSKEQKVLSFCFIDPFSLKIKFNTIKKLGEKLIVDFLILLAFGMDGKRNISIYIEENNDRIDNFLGITDWRVRWREAEKNGLNLVKFLADEFTSQMVKIGYLNQANNNFISIKSDEKNLPLYYLAFYSKHARGYDFWNKVKQLSDQPELGL
ncbi:MAG: three-Cys-motif partner protein TcmP [Melioribacter sp.]|nr:three-Cys-motif partner protein TcmP [Melioribacter sp.]